MMRYMIYYKGDYLGPQPDLRNAFVSLRDTLISLSNLTSGAVRYHDAALIEVDDNSIGEALERICRAAGALCELPSLLNPQAAAPENGGSMVSDASNNTMVPETVSATVSTETPAAVQEQPSLPLCRYCQEPFIPNSNRQQICKKPECQRAYNREYQAKYARRRRAAAEAEADAGKAEADPQDPFQGVDAKFVWYIPENIYLEMEDLLTALEAGSLPVGTILRLRDSAIPWEVY